MLHMNPVFLCANAVTHKTCITFPTSVHTCNCWFSVFLRKKRAQLRMLHMLHNLPYTTKISMNLPPKEPFFYPHIYVDKHLPQTNSALRCYRMVSPLVVSCRRFHHGGR